MVGREPGPEGARGIAVRRELMARTPRCREIAASNAEVLNMGSAASLEMPHPIYITDGDGCRVRDADGNEYIDTMLGFGTHVMGHGFAPVRAAVAEQMAHGWHFGIHNPLQEVLARLAIDAVPCAERVIFCNSGSEATMYAIRVARAFTGKWRVAMCDGFYHGAHDYGMVVADPASDRRAPGKVTMGAGIPPWVVEQQVLLPYREDAAFDLVRQHRDELAVVMVEGVQSSNPHLDPDLGDWLRQLAAVCRECGVLLMMDEVITGFRIAFGGVQEHFGVTPDLSTHAKTLGGGFPIGAVAGRADIMKLFQGAASGDPRGIFSGGTFSGNPVTMAAGAALVGHLQAHRGTVYPLLAQRGAQLRARVEAHVRERNMAVRMLTAGSMFQLYFQSEPIRSSRDIRGRNARAERDFYLHLLANGVLIPGTRRAFLSAAHGERDVDQLADAIAASLDACRDDGLL